MQLKLEFLNTMKNDTLTAVQLKCVLNFYFQLNT